MMESVSFQTLAEKFSKTKQEWQETENTLRSLKRVRVKEPLHVSRNEDHFEKYAGKYPLPNKFQSRKLDQLTSAEDDDLDDYKHTSENHSLQSAVMKVKQTAERRKDAIDKQNIDPKLKSRNCRILGMLQNTLRTFQYEAAKRRQQDMKKIEIERKVEVAQEEEKERVNKQIIKLHLAADQKLLKLDCLAEMMDLIESHETWKKNQSYLLNFMITTTEPKICFLPKHHTQISKKVHKKSKMKIIETIGQHEANLKDELSKYEHNLSELSKCEHNLSAMNEDHRLHDVQDNSGFLKDEHVVSEAITNDYTNCAKKKVSTEIDIHLNFDEELNFD